MQNELAALANLAANSSATVMTSGANVLKEHYLNNVIPPLCAQKHRQNTIYIHDLEFYDITYNCLGVSAKDMIDCIDIDLARAVRTIYRKVIELANLQSGGIGFIDFDNDLANFVKHESDESIVLIFREFFTDLNLCTKKGCEKPYLSFNFGLGLSQNARKISFALLSAFELGDMNGRPFIFPNLIFKLKKEINFNVDSPNYDIYLKAVAVTAQKMIPTYLNCDSTANSEFSANELGIMGCRTRIAANKNGKLGALKRGNVCCVTLNLPQIGFEARTEPKFFELLKKNLELASTLLLHRFERLCKSNHLKHINGLRYYEGDISDGFDKLKNGTLSIGFIGLWDLISNLEKDNIDSLAKLKKYHEKALTIVRYMRNFVDTKANETGLNFSLLASSAEGVTGKFATNDAKLFGEDYNASKKGFYTNSFHIPVDLNLSFYDKLYFEGPFHTLCNGGSISYVEFAEIPGQNSQAVREAVQSAYDNDCNYVGINFKLDFCNDCGYFGKIGQQCKLCGSKHIKKLRRVSGYLSEESSFTKGKKMELSSRTTHNGNLQC